jgi:hypothetical protein
MEHNLDTLCKAIGVPKPPEFVRDYWAGYKHGGQALFQPGEIRRRLSPHGSSEAGIAKAEAVAARIEADEVLRVYTDLLRRAMAAQNDRWAIDLWRPVKPACLKPDAGDYMFLLLLSALPLHEERMRKRGIPEETIGPLLNGAVGRSAEDFAKTGSWALRDMVWQMNFFTGHIFHFDRLQFILEPCRANLVLFKDGAGATCALSNGRLKFRADGQPDGSSGAAAGDNGFTTVYKETKDGYQGHRVSPLGFVYAERTVLPKARWRPVIRNDDWTMNIHIPWGEGYTPERFRNSCELAADFFAKYFPDYDIKGFMCDSWLFDGALQFALPEEKSNIIKIQRQVFLCPQKTDDSQMIGDAFEGAPRDALPQKTSLQRAVKALMDRGVLFHTQGMLLPSEDLRRFGQTPFFTDAEFAEFTSRSNCSIMSANGHYH